MTKRIISLLLVCFMLISCVNALAVDNCRHEFAETHVRPTCTEAGYSKGTCKLCGYTWYDEGQPALGHTFSWTVIEPTCTEDGTKTGVCDRCGHTWVGTIPANGHKWTAWVVDIEATLTEPGRRERHCSVCGLTEYEYFTLTGSSVSFTKQVTNYDGHTPYGVGDCIDYELTVTNTGSTRLKDVEVYDWYLNQKEGYLSTIEAIEPGESYTCCAGYIVTNEDASTGEKYNIALVQWAEYSADSSEEYEAVNLYEVYSNPVTVPVAGDETGSGITVTKRLVTELAEEEWAFPVDEQLKFEVVITNNTGADIMINDVYDFERDSGDSILIDGVGDLLAAGDDMKYWFYASIADLAPGKTKGTVTDIVEVTWSFTDGREGGVAESNPVTVTILKGEEALSVRKVPVGFDPDEITFGQDDNVSFSVYVKNNTDEEIPGFVLFDSIIETNSYFYVDSFGAIAPGEEVEVSFEYYVTGEDCARGQVTDVAYVFIDEGQDEFDLDYAYPSGEVTIYCEGTAPDITVEKSVMNLAEHSMGFAEGDLVEYMFIITNNTEHTVYDAVLKDGYINDSADVGELATGESAYVYFNYVVKEPDCVNGSIYNVGTLTGTYLREEFSIDSNPVTVPTRVLLPEPEKKVSMAVNKQVISVAAAADGRYVEGEPVVYLVTVTNTGDVPLTDFTVTDVVWALTGPVEEYQTDSAPLAPGESRSYVFTRVVDPDSCATGYVIDSAWVTAATEDGSEEIVEYSNDCTVYTKLDGGEVSQSASLMKYVISTPKHSCYLEGETVTFLVVFYNNSDRAYHDLAVYDILSDTPGGLIASESVIAPHDYVAAVFDYIVTDFDADIMGSVTNIAWSVSEKETGETEYLYSNEVTVPCGNTPAPVPSYGSSCVKTLVASNNGAELVRTDLCAAHHALELRAQAMDDPEKIADMWTMNVCTMYSALAAKTGSDAICIDRDMFLAEITSLRNTLGSDGIWTVIDILRERATELCYEMSGLERRDDILTPETENALPAAASDTCEVDVRTSSAAWYQTCAAAAGGHLMTQNSVDRITTAIAGNPSAVSAGLERISSMWTTALTGEYTQLMKLNPAFAAGMALYTPSIEARRNALKAVYPDKPDLVAGLIIREIRNRTLELCGYEGEHR